MIMLVLLLGRFEGAQAQDKRDQRGRLGPQLLQVGWPSPTKTVRKPVPGIKIFCALQLVLKAKFVKKCNSLITRCSSTAALPLCRTSRQQYSLLGKALPT